VAIAFVQGGRDAGADRLEGAEAAAVQRCRHVEFLTDLQHDREWLTATAQRIQDRELAWP
jgi:hypothetical protein